MTDPVKTIARTDAPEDDASTGQPLWYWGLSHAGREDVQRRRAASAGTEYGEDLSRVGCKPDGEIDRAAYRPDRAKNDGPRMGRRKRAEFERRIIELAKGKKEETT